MYVTWRLLLPETNIGATKHINISYKMSAMYTTGRQVVLETGFKARISMTEHRVKVGDNRFNCQPHHFKDKASVPRNTSVASLVRLRH